MNVNYKESILHIVTPNRHGRDLSPIIRTRWVKSNLNIFPILSSSSLQHQKEEFAAQYEERLDVSSLIDYFIFINLLSAYDNTGRNVFWGIYNVNLTLLPKFIIQPWDLDGTLGRTWDAIKLDPEKVLVLTTG
ncbi:CotH kinase family protein [Bacteroides thetaiotaomicron]|uniref:CotH kinase family protein n=1 Tax=Bacteroides thetaiotaomicron TaxID=818 RepID=UPI0035AF628C